MGKIMNLPLDGSPVTIVDAESDDLIKLRKKHYEDLDDIKLKGADDAET